MQQLRTRLSSFPAIAAIMVAGLVLVAGCGKSGASSGGEEGGGDGPTVGLVTDVGGLSDRSFNFQANKGLEDAKAEVDAQGTVIESKSAGDYEANLGQLVEDGNDLVIGVGFTMAEPMQSVAEQATDQKFAIVDYSVTQMGDLPNVRGLTFKEQEAGYLAGALAGMVEEEGTLDGLNSAKVVSVIGGQKIPPVDRYIAGYQAGVKEYCSGCTVLVDYSQDFLDQAKCQDRALAQIDKGSDIVFQVAGLCGAGALDAAKQKGVWGIGVDADQSDLGPHILTSAMKRVDVAVSETIAMVADGTFEGGVDAVYGLAEDGVALGTIAPAAKKYEPELAPVIADIKAGKVEIPEEVA